MANSEFFKVPKLKKQVTLWVHPEGQVIGEIFLLEQSSLHAGSEQPIEALNHDAPFIVISMEAPSQLRFYNRNSVIRVEYIENEFTHSESITRIDCQIQMMDGSLLDGQVIEMLPQDRSRIFDYLNHSQDRFIKLYTSDEEVCLINKSYINYVITR